MMIETRPCTRLDTAFARFLSARARLDGQQNQRLESLLIRLSFEQNQGHNCLAINAEDRELCLASGLADFAGRLPLVVEKDRLYLQRYWHYENRLAMQLNAMINKTCSDDIPDSLLDRYFPALSDGTDWQREAVKMVAKQSFCMITGGPGTGKTTTVLKILAVLQELAATPLLIALAAPTGKAAMRLQESIGSRMADLACDADIKKHIPDMVSTLHRLLGARPPSPYFRHNAEQPLVYDLIVVDEASMVDLALMSKLVDALKSGARLILLGDKDQLASVESGAVLADLTQALPNSTLELKTSHRFGGIIKKLADAVNSQQADEAWQILQQGDACCRLLDDDLVSYAAEQQADYLRLINAGGDFADIFRTFNRFQVLCSNRQGKNSVADINDRIEQKLLDRKRIVLSGLWYVGRPVMITQNNAALHLYNGDLGLCMPDRSQGGKLMVFFQYADGSIKKYLPARLPQCETAYAMTIHKSQGSEFEEILIVLPETINPVLTKELLYTAITRAKKSLRLSAGETVFLEAVKQKVHRITGLVDKFKTGTI